MATLGRKATLLLRVSFPSYDPPGVRSFGRTRRSSSIYLGCLHATTRLGFLVVRAQERDIVSDALDRFLQLRRLWLQGLVHRSVCTKTCWLSSIASGRLRDGTVIAVRRWLVLAVIVVISWFRNNLNLIII